MNKINKIIIDGLYKYNIYSDFDSGSIKEVVYSNFVFSLIVCNDWDLNNNEGNSCSWFYFKVKNLIINTKYKFIISKIGILKKLLVK